MLEEYKKIYEKQAQLLKACSPHIEWKKCSKKLLCDGCVNAYGMGNDTLAERYLSALIYRYWNLLNKLELRSPIISTHELVYSWYIDGILYAVKNHPWTNCKSTLYKDPKGYEKCINRCIETNRATYYQSINRYKRAANFNNASLNEYIENGVEPFYTEDDKEINSNIDVHNMVIKYFKKKQYFKCFLIDVIINNPCTDTNKNFNKTRVFKYIRELDKDIAKRISYDYGLDEEEVKCAVNEIQSLSNAKIHNRIDWSLNDLRMALIKNGVFEC